MNRIRASFVVLALLCPVAARADVVLTWNEYAMRTLASQVPAVSPFAQARFGAIVQLAVFEAVNAITHDYEPYLGVVAPVGASPEAAAATAAYKVLKNYFPAAAGLQQLYDDSLAAIPNGSAKANGITTGELAAAAMIANRVGDGSAPPAISPVGPPNPGVWQVTLPPGCPAGQAGGSFYQWQNVKPFGVPSVLDFLLDPPPSITSTEFTKAYNEVKSVGAVNSTERPLDRANVARFYAASSPTYIFNMAARQVSKAEHKSLSHNAWALALLNMATSDSLVASFANKYHYNFWRPENAIRFGDFGNSKVESDPAYAPFITTPCFPSYPSNHASGSNGAAEILRRVYGESGHAITVTNTLSAPIANLVFEYSSFNQICNDVDDARVFGGIHFSFDQAAGNRLGREIATYVYKNNLQKANGSQ